MMDLKKRMTKTARRALVRACMRSCARTVAASALAIATTTAAAQAGNCDAIRAQIDAKIKARGVTNHSLTVAGVDDKVTGKVVGTCDQGRKKIVYAQGERDEVILTECRDGSAPVGGVCKK